MGKEEADERREAGQRHAAPSAVAAIPERYGLAKNIGFSVGGEFAYVVTQMVVLTALARFGSAEAVGEFGLALAVVTPVFMMANMGVRTGQTSDVSERFVFAEYGGLVSLTAIGATLLSIAIGYFLAPTASAFLIVALMSVTKAFEAISNLSYGAFQQAGRMDKVAGSLLLRGSVTAAAFVSLLSMGVAPSLAFTAQLAVWGTLALFRDYPAASRLTSGALVAPSLRRERLRLLAKETAPVGGGHLMNALLVSLPRIVIERTLDLHALGLFTVVGYLQQAGTLVVNAISHALVNRFARLRQHDERRELRRIAGGLFCFAVLGTLIVVAGAELFGAQVLVILFGPDFRAAHDVLVLVAIAVCFKFFSAIPQSLMHADRRFVTYFWFQAASVAVCLILALILIPEFGLIGAGLTAVAVAAFRLAVLVVATLFPFGTSRRPCDAPRRNAELA